MKEYWFEIPPNSIVKETTQLKIVAEDSMSMLSKLKEYWGWKESVFLGYIEVKNNAKTRTKKKPNKQ